MTLGKILTGEHHRDAIHVAIAPVFAAERLGPGHHVLLNDAGEAISRRDGAVGIVDPFIERFVEKGEQFYLWLYPNTVTGMRHHWQHPGFPEKATPTAFSCSKSESEAWLRQFCNTADCPGFDATIAAATGRLLKDVDGYGRSYQNDGEYLFFSGRDAHGEIPPEFWDHVQNYTGIEIPKSERAEYFSCSC